MSLPNRPTLNPDYLERLPYVGQLPFNLPSPEMLAHNRNPNNCIPLNMSSVTYPSPGGLPVLNAVTSVSNMSPPFNAPFPVNHQIPASINMSASSKVSPHLMNTCSPIQSNLSHFSSTDKLAVNAIIQAQNFHLQNSTGNLNSNTVVVKSEESGLIPYKPAPVDFLNNVSANSPKIKSIPVWQMNEKVNSALCAEHKAAKAQKLTDSDHIEGLMCSQTTKGTGVSASEVHKNNSVKESTPTQPQLGTNGNLHSQSITSNNNGPVSTGTPPSHNKIEGIDLSLSQANRQTTQCISTSSEKQVLLPNALNAVEAVHMCNICNKTFKRKDHVKRHKKKFHANQMDNAPNTNVTETVSNSLSCNDNINLLSFAAAASSSACVSHSCNTSSFSQESKVNPQVQELVSQEFPYECTDCQKIFTRKDHVLRHKVTHSKQKPYECDLCLKIFSRKDHLKRHRNGHTKEICFDCDQCDKVFTRKDHLDRHLQRHHNGQLKKISTD